MSRKYGTLISEMLMAVGKSTGAFEWPLEYSEAWRYKQLSRRKEKYYRVVWEAKKKGLLKQVKKEGRKFLQLTKRGELEILINKMGLESQTKWDGKWRVVVFDIPEAARDKRDQLRGLLKRFGFIKLQASVFIHPFALNRESIIYLQESGLIKYIRLLKVEEIDNDKDLKEKFKI